MTAPDPYDDAANSVMVQLTRLSRGWSKKRLADEAGENRLETACDGRGVVGEQPDGDRRAQLRAHLAGEQRDAGVREGHLFRGDQHAELGDQGQHALLRLVERQHAREQQRAHVGHGGAHRVALLAEHVPQCGGAGQGFWKIDASVRMEDPVQGYGTFRMNIPSPGGGMLAMAGLGAAMRRRAWRSGAPARRNGHGQTSVS